MSKGKIQKSKTCAQLDCSSEKNKTALKAF
jgi:hypothetical protein